MRRLGYLFVASVTASMLVATSAEAVPSEPDQSREKWRPALISSESLYDGSVIRRRYEDGVTVVASAGAKVIFSRHDKPFGDEGSAKTTKKRMFTRSVSVVLPNSRPDLQDAQTYKNAGRSVRAEAAAAGFSPAQARQMENQAPSRAASDNPPIWDSGCLYIDDDPDYQWSGCYIRYVTEDADPDAYYSTESAKAFGWGTGVLGGGKELVRGASQHIYTNPDSEMIDADPSSGTDDSSACRSVSLGVSSVVEASISVPLCPDRWVVIRDTYLHHAEWQGGSAGGSSDTVSVGHVVQVRNPEGTFGFYVYSIGATVVCFFCT